MQRNTRTISSSFVENEQSDNEEEDWEEEDDTMFSPEFSDDEESFSSNHSQKFLSAVALYSFQVSSPAP